jgi:hypothetical protein
MRACTTNNRTMTSTIWSISARLVAVRALLLRWELLVSAKIQIHRSKRAVSADVEGRDSNGDMQGDSGNVHIDT